MSAYRRSMTLIAERVGLALAIGEHDADLDSGCLDPLWDDPTPEEIRRECRRIRATWPPGERRRRRMKLPLHARRIL